LFIVEPAAGTCRGRTRPDRKTHTISLESADKTSERRVRFAHQLCLSQSHNAAGLDRSRAAGESV